MSARLLVLLACALSFALPSRAQTSERFTIAVRGEPLAQALTQFARHAEIDLAYDPELAEGVLSYCVAENVTAEQALTCLLRGSGMDFVRLSNGAYVVRPVARAETREGTLVGVVRDARSSLGLPEASVLLLARATRGTATNADGQFIFSSLAPGRYGVLISYVGYQTQSDTITVLPGGRVRYEAYMERVNYAVSPLVIDGLTISPLADQSSFQTLTPVSSSADYSGLSGVSINHATADVHIQGGGAGEHQITLDGVPIFAPPTLTGQVGAFSPLAVGRMRVKKAGFGVQPSSNTVGIIELDHDLSSQPGHQFDAQVDALSSGARHRYSSSRGQGPSVRTMVSGRVGMWSLYRQLGAQRILQQQNVPDALIQTAFEAPPFLDEVGSLLLLQDSLLAYLVPGSQIQRRDPSLSFADVNAALRWAPGPLRHLHASGYLSRRALETEGITTTPRLDTYAWTSAMAQARYTTFLGDRTFASVQLRGAFYQQEHDFSILEAPSNLESGADVRLAEVARPVDDGNMISEVGAELSIDHALGRGAYLQAGLVPTFTRQQFAFSTVRFSATGSNSLSNESSGARLASYANLRVPVGLYLAADLGVRTTYVPVSRALYYEPRISLELDLPRTPLGPARIRTSAGRYLQFVSQYRVSSRSVTTLASSSTVWITVDPNRLPTGAYHAAGEFAVRPATHWRLFGEGFYKFLDRLYDVDYSVRPVDEGDTPQSDFLRRARGFAGGFSVGADRTTERVAASLRYEFSRTTRGESNSFEGRRLVVPWNEPGRILARIDAKMSTRVSAAARWTSVFGRSWAFRQSYYDFIASTDDDLLGNIPAFRREGIERHIAQFDLENPESNRLNAFHQLDLSAAYTLPIGRSSVQVRGDLLNVFGRRNEVERQFIGNGGYYSRNALYEPMTRHGLPRSLSWAVRWTML